MKHRKLVLSTNNIHKVEEIKDILKDLPIEVLSKKRFGVRRIRCGGRWNYIRGKQYKESKGFI